jgi:hypothetical protein
MNFWEEFFVKFSGKSLQWMEKLLLGENRSREIVFSQPGEGLWNNINSWHVRNFQTEIIANEAIRKIAPKVKTFPLFAYYARRTFVFFCVCTNREGEKKKVFCSKDQLCLVCFGFDPFTHVFRTNFQLRRSSFFVLFSPQHCFFYRNSPLFWFSMNNRE